VLENRAELEMVVARRGGLGPVFARHAYGMRRWVDLFATKIPELRDPREAELVARIVADNARHMVLFRERALAHGVDPDSYVPPPEGEAIYEPIPELRTAEALAYALGSLEHFGELLDVYRAAADGEDAEVVDTVRADNDRTIAKLAPLVRERGGPVAEAHERYRVRELAETPLYAYAR
jgi:hypothetical protein